MKKINILVNNVLKEVNAIKNFKIDNNKYFIYSLDEIDEEGYQILYVVKVVSSDNILLGSGMLEATEWSKFVESIKEIIKCNKEGKPINIENLNVDNLEKLTINEGRPFKLKKELVEELNKDLNNKEAYDDLIPKEELISQVNTVDQLEQKEEKDYQKLYEEERIFNEELKTENEKLKQKLNRIQETINELMNT